MNSLLARHVFYPLQDRLCGRDSLAYARGLADTECWPADRLRELQSLKLQSLLAHAQGQVPFYRDLFGNVGLDVRDIKAVEDLAALPALTKDDVRRHRERMVAPSLERHTITSCTSGSSGSPLIFRVGRRRCRADIAARIRAHGWFGVHPGDRAIYLWGSRIELDRQDKLKAIRDWLVNERLLSAFDLSDRQLRRYARVFRKLRPASVYSYASTLWRFAEFAGRQAPELHGMVRRAAFVTGEQLLPNWRRDIVAALGCPLAEEYGCREAGLIAHECPAGAYHISAENLILEVLDDAGVPVPTGTTGNLVVTNLEAYAMPFIRYQTGDRGALRTGRCECGRGLPLMQRPTGRTFEFLETQDGTRLSGVALSRDLKEVEGISHYRVIQETRERVRVLIVPNERYHREEGEALIRRMIRARIGPQTEIPIHYLERLPPHPSGKYHYIVNAM